MSNDERDRELGMRRRITRRDFLDGVSMAVGAKQLAKHGVLVTRLSAAEDAVKTPCFSRPRPPGAARVLRGNRLRRRPVLHPDV